MPLEALAGDPFDALGDPNRRAIVGMLRGGDRSVGELADELPISRPAVSRHLRLLKDAGLVTDRPEGTRRLYRLHDEGIEAVGDYLEEMWGEAATRFKLVAENTARREDSPSAGRADDRSPQSHRRRSGSGSRSTPSTGPKRPSG